MPPGQDFCLLYVRGRPEGSCRHRSSRASAPPLRTIRRCECLEVKQPAGIAGRLRSDGERAIDETPPAGPLQTLRLVPAVEAAVQRAQRTLPQLAQGVTFDPADAQH